MPGGASNSHSLYVAESKATTTARPAKMSVRKAEKFLLNLSSEKVF